ncbi:hypothetical protein FRC02_010597 [Tulasnella sp. 418]|nr:hypothetical protein FRC02_010597 [Tulasnella sp. 418]
MAIDLLQDSYCDHYLRFDFESTLWLGLYWCLQYDDDGKKIRDRNFIAEWSLGDFMEVAKEKDGYLIHPIDFKREHESLDEGIGNLREVIRQMYDEAMNIYRSVKSRAGLGNKFQELNRTAIVPKPEAHWSSFIRLAAVRWRRRQSSGNQRVVLFQWSYSKYGSRVAQRALIRYTGLLVIIQIIAKQPCLRERA